MYQYIRKLLYTYHQLPSIKQYNLSWSIIKSYEERLFIQIPLLLKCNYLVSNGTIGKLKNKFLSLSELYHIKTNIYSNRLELEDYLPITTQCGIQQMMIHIKTGEIYLLEGLDIYYKFKNFHIYLQNYIEIYKQIHSIF